MFKVQEDVVEVLGICVDEPVRTGRYEGLGFHAAHSGRRAIDMLRMLSFDFVLVGSRLPDMGCWDLLRHLKTAHPQQKWAFVSPSLNEQQEVTARMFGTTTLFDATPTTEELLNLTSRMRERAIQNVISGRFSHSNADFAPARIAM